MGVESATYLSELVPANPPGTDTRAQGDNHLRLLKSVLQSTIPSQGSPIHTVVDIGAAAITIDPLVDNNKVFALIGNTVTQPLPAGADCPDGFTVWFVCYGFTFTIMAAGADLIAVHGQDVTEEIVVTYDDGVLLYNGDWVRLTWTAGHWYAFQHCRPRVTSVNGMQGDVIIDAADINAILGGTPILDENVNGKPLTAEDLGGMPLIENDFKGTKQSLTTNGYQKLPGGLILQWGQVPAVPNGSFQTFTYPIPFPTAVFMATSTPNGTTYGGGNNEFWGVSSVTNSSLRVYNFYDSNPPGFVFVIGY